MCGSAADVRIGVEVNGRRVKAKVLDLLASSDLDSSLSKLLRLPPKSVITCLFSFIGSADEETKWTL